jgi:hypothetical protein
MDRVGEIHNVLRRCQTGLTGISAKKRAFSFSTLGQGPLEKTAHLRILPKFCQSFTRVLPNVPQLVPGQRHFHIRRTRGNR